MITDKFNFNFNRKWLMWGGIAFLTLFIIFFVVLIIFWRNTPNTPNETNNNTLPGTEDSLFMPDDSDDTTNPTSNPPSPDTNDSPEKLLIDIEYSRQETFTLAVKNIARTVDSPNVHYYKTAPGALYSIIEVFDTRGNIIFEQKISLPTAVIIDGPNVGAPPMQALNESESRLIIPVPKNAIPKEIIISGAGGEEISRREFSFETLPFENLDLNNNPTSSSEHPNILGIQTAQAQGTSTFKIVVVGHENVSSETLLKTTLRTSSMAQSIKPWSEFRDRIEIVSLRTPPGRSLNCQVINLGSGTYPLCPIYPVTSIVENIEPGWSAIIIATEFNCNCGAVQYNGGFAPIVAAGNDISSGVIAHEMGHSVGNMTDEYIYQYVAADAEPVMEGSNCFASEAKCEAATSAFPSASCSAGCNGGTNKTWRPADKIMRNSYGSNSYGPLEKCILGNIIATKIGISYNCTDDPEESPTAPPPIDDGERYWGHGLR